MMPFSAPWLEQTASKSWWTERVAPDQFNATLDAIGWSRRTLAEKLGLNSDRVIRLWAGDGVPVPPPVACWLRRVAQTLEELPPPKEWTWRLRLSPR